MYQLICDVDWSMARNAQNVNNACTELVYRIFHNIFEVSFPRKIKRCRILYSSGLISNILKNEKYTKTLKNTKERNDYERFLKNAGNNITSDPISFVNIKKGPSDIPRTVRKPNDSIDDNP